VRLSDTCSLPTRALPSGKDMGGLGNQAGAKGDNSSSSISALDEVLMNMLELQKRTFRVSVQKKRLNLRVGQSLEPTV